MKITGNNIVSIGLIALAAFMIYTKTEGWGWCVICALILNIKDEF